MAGGPQPFSNSFKGPAVGSLRYNTAQKGSVVPVCFGTQRVTVNIMAGFGYTANTGGGKKGGGKGGGKSGGKKGGNNSYSVNVDFGLCLGPISFTGSPQGFEPSGGGPTVNRVWADGSVAGTDRVPVNYYAGNLGQAPDPVFAASGDPPILGYSGLAHATGTPLFLGSSPVLPNLQVEITGFGAGTGGPSFAGDARPDYIVTKLLCDAVYGCGFPVANLDLGATWSTNTVVAPGVAGATVTLAAGQSVVPGTAWFSPNGNFQFTFQVDQNLVLYEGATILWSSGTAGSGATSLNLQTDGNLVLYAGGTPVFSTTGTGPYTGSAAQLWLQNDGNLVLYNNWGDGVGSVGDWGTYCQAAELAMSYIMDRQQQASRWVDEIATLTASAVVWSGNILKFVPYADGSSSGNGAAWSPNLTWRYSLTDDDYLPWSTGGTGDTSGDDPVVVSRIDPSVEANWYGVEFEDTSYAYNREVVPAFDQGFIDAYGLKTQPSVQAIGFTNATSATASGQLQLQRKLYVRNTYKFKLGWRYSLLEPMDIVLLTDIATGLNLHPCRITEIEEDENGDLTISAEEIPTGAP